MKPSIPLLTFSLLACAGDTAFAHHGESGAWQGPWEVRIVDEWGRDLPTWQHRGRTYVVGERGRRYAIRVSNRSPRRIEAVVSVDGRDAIDGRPATWGRRGYVVDAYGDVEIDGFRTSLHAVAAFRFSSVRDSYAARMGDARSVGVIGVAIFPERESPPPRPIAPLPYPHRWYGGRAGGETDAAEPPERSARGAVPPASSRAEADDAAGALGRGPRGGADSAHPDSHARRERPGLGTAFGERRDSHAVEVTFRRARNHPEAVLALRYDDREGLIAMGVPIGWPEQTEADAREGASPFREMPARPVRFSQPPPGW